MKVAVIGRSGQLARCLADARPHGVNAVFFGREQLDLGAAHVNTNTLGDFGPDLIINAAAYTHVDRAEAEPAAAFAINADGPRALALHAYHADIPLIHISTDYVFDGAKSGAYVETDTTNPVSIYGASKWAGEEAVRETLHRHLIFRTSWVFSQYGQNFVKTMLRLSRTNPTLRIVADQTGCPTSAAALANAIWQVVRSKDAAWGTYHAAGSPVTTWAEFAEAIFDGSAPWLGARPTVTPIPARDYPTAAMRPQNSALSCAKFEATFGLKLGHWRDDLTQTLDALRQQEVV